MTRQELRAVQLVETAERLGAQLTVDIDPSWPLASSRVVARALILGDGGERHEKLEGHGSGPDPETAALCAVMELAERRAQFRPGPVDGIVMASYSELGSAAVHPGDLGLYAPSQYRWPSTDLVPFDAERRRPWIGATELGSGRDRLVPVEFVHPRITTDGTRLVAETSNGTAAHYHGGAALDAALLELIEKDAALMTWYRGTPVRPVPADLAAPVAGELDEIRGLGFVVAAFLLHAVIDVPTALVIAVRGRSYGYGLGCAPEVDAAVGHALGELGSRLRWLLCTPPRTTLRAPLDAASAPAQSALYNGGPLHQALRGFLTATRDAEPPPSGAHPPVSVREALLAAGVPVYVRTLDVPGLEPGEVSVARALSAGLIPFHIGAGRERLSCARLTGRCSPGRLRTLLPHCFV